MKRTTTYAALTILAASTTLMAYACGGDEDSELAGSDDASAQNGPGAGTGGATTDVGVGEVGVGVGGMTGQGGTGGACGALELNTVHDPKPADIIFVIDNSGSMGDEILAVEQNINVNFAAIIQASGIDYQVIMVTQHGASQLNVCIGPPLSGTTNCSGQPVAIPGQFQHYSTVIYSLDSLCKTLGAADGTLADTYNVAPNGWQTWLRPEAVKVFVEITDDGISCNGYGYSYSDGGQINTGQQMAINWDADLLGLNPVQFGTAANRNYIYYSIIGLPGKSNMQPYNEFEPVVTGSCNTAYNPGTTYQWLSKGTGALRFPVCSTASYDAVFNDIAAGVVDVTSVPCEFDLPPAPPNEEYDLNTLRIQYTPGGMGAPQTFVKVDSAALCMPGAFYVTGTDPYHVTICPQACAVIEADPDAEVKAELECGFVPT